MSYSCSALFISGTLLISLHGRKVLEVTIIYTAMYNTLCFCNIHLCQMFIYLSTVVFVCQCRLTIITPIKCVNDCGSLSSCIPIAARRQLHMSTRIVNMQCESSLPPLVERIYSSVTRLTVKCLYFPYLSPHYSQLIRTSLGPARPVPPILPAGRALIRSISSLLRNLDLDIPAADVPLGPPQWLLPTPKVS